MFQKTQSILLAYRNRKLIRNYHELTSLMSDSEFLVVTYLNPHVMRSVNVLELSAVPEWYFVVDGVYVAWIFSLLTGDRFSPLNIDDSGIANQLIHQINAENEVPLFMGGTQHDATAFMSHQSQTGASVKCLDGYSSLSSQEFLDSDAKVKFVSLGSPLQEQFIMKHLGALAETSKVVFSCGGFVGQLSRGAGVVYPEFVKNLNIRFLYRVVSEPGTLKRILLAYVPFFLMALLFGLVQRVSRLKARF